MAAGNGYPQPGVGIASFSIETLDAVVGFLTGILTVVAAHSQVFIDKQGIGRFAQAIVQEKVQQAF